MTQKKKKQCGKNVGGGLGALWGSPLHDSNPLHVKNIFRHGKHFSNLCVNFSCISRDINRPYIKYPKISP